MKFCNDKIYKLISSSEGSSTGPGKKPSTDPLNIFFKGHGKYQREKPSMKIKSTENDNRLVHEDCFYDTAHLQSKLIIIVREDGDTLHMEVMSFSGFITPRSREPQDALDETIYRVFRTPKDYTQFVVYLYKKRKGCIFF